MSRAASALCLSCNAAVGPHHPASRPTRPTEAQDPPLTLHCACPSAAPADLLTPRAWPHTLYLLHPRTPNAPRAAVLTRQLRQQLAQAASSQLSTRPRSAAGLGCPCSRGTCGRSLGRPACPPRGAPAWGGGGGSGAGWATCVRGVGGGWLLAVVAGIGRAPLSWRQRLASIRGLLHCNRHHRQPQRLHFQLQLPASPAVSITSQRLLWLQPSRAQLAS